MTRRLPDFLVIGVQKSGTTDLCAYLSGHPNVFISDPKELFFFCRDDLDVLPHTFFERYEEWLAFDWEGDRERLLDRYARNFEAARADQHCGEGTTVYLPSRVAARRIEQTLPEARFVAILRNPVKRAHSAYFHHLKMRRSTETFANHLRYEQGSTLAFGHYEEQLREWFDRFGRERVHVVLFEEYVRDRRGVANGVLEFLGLPPMDADAPTRGNSNTAQVPGSPRLQRVLNQALRLYPARFTTIKYDLEVERPLWELALSSSLRGIGALNLRMRSRYGKMDPEMAPRLETYFRRRNAGLADLLGRDLSIWGWS